MSEPKTRTLNGWYSAKYHQIAGHYFLQTDIEGSGPRMVSFFTSSDKPGTAHGDELFVGVFLEFGEPGYDRKRWPEREAP